MATLPDEAFKTLKPEDFLAHKESVTIVDFWSCLPDAIHAHPKVQYVSIGRCISNTVSTEKPRRLLAGAIDYSRASP